MTPETFSKPSIPWFDQLWIEILQRYLVLTLIGELSPTPQTWAEDRIRKTLTWRYVLDSDHERKTLLLEIESLLTGVPRNLIDRATFENLIDQMLTRRLNGLPADLDLGLFFPSLKKPTEPQYVWEARIERIYGLRADVAADLVNCMGPTRSNRFLWAEASKKLPQVAQSKKPSHTAYQIAAYKAFSAHPLIIGRARFPAAPTRKRQFTFWLLDPENPDLHKGQIPDVDPSKRIGPHLWKKPQIDPVEGSE